MKYFTLLLLVFATLLSCKSENTVRDNAPATSTNAPTPPPNAVVNIIGGAHYVCTSPGCAGKGAAGAGNCEVCSSALVHNQGFHNQSTPASTANEGLSPLFTNPSAAPSDPSAPAAISTTPTAEPAQNANGVWHYTCSNGCAGGAGSAIACASCGSTLAHNQGYH